MSSAALSRHSSALHRRLLSAERPWDVVDATVLFADVSGFTALNERLARRGREGAELMVGLLDAMFAPMIDAAEDHGGELWKFGGDALLLGFTGVGHERRAVASAAAIRSIIRRRTQAHRAIGRVSLDMSMGIAAGPVVAMLCGREHRELILGGPTIAAALAAESAAGPGELVADDRVASTFETTQRIDGLWSMDVEPTGPIPTGAADPPARSPDSAPSTHSDLGAAALTASLRGHLSDPQRFAEHRLVASAFVKVGIDLPSGDRRRVATVHRHLDRLATTLERLCSRHEVALLTADAGVDSTKFVLLSGAPTNPGDTVDRLLDVCTELAEEAPGDLSIGVNEGVVFCGEITARARSVYAVIGDAVNLAARVMARAEAGQVLCERTTFDRSTAPRVNHTVEPFLAKGLTRPIEAMRIGPRSTSGRDDAIAQIDLTGRDREVLLLQQLWNEVGAGLARTVEILGPVGQGKSTLLAWFADAHADSTQLFVSGERFGRLSPFRALSIGLRRLWSIPDDPVAARLRLAELVPPELAAWSPLIGVAIGLDVGSTPEVEDLAEESKAARLAEVVVDLLMATAVAPFMVLVDDCSWLDDASAMVVNHLIDQVDAPVLTILCRREDAAGYEPDPNRLERIDLSPIDDRSSRTILRAQRPGLDASTVTAIIERASGNPLFLLSLASTVGVGDELPATIEDAIRVELDRFPPAARRLIGELAVIGRTFDVRFAAEVMRCHEADLRRRIDPLRTFVTITDGYAAFTQPLRGEVAYQALPSAVRVAFHGDVAAAAEKDRAAPAELMSIHLTESRQWAAAWPWTIRAAEEAVTSLAPLVAVAHYERALTCARRLASLGSGPRGQIEERLGALHELIGDFGPSERHLRTAYRLASSDADRARIAVRLAALCRLASDLPAGHRWVARAETLVRTVPDDSLRAATARERGGLWFVAGHLNQSLDAHLRAVHLATAAGDRPQLARSLRMVGTIDELQGRSGVRPLRRSAAIAKSIGDLAEEAAALNNLGAAWYDRGEWARALEAYSDAAEASNRCGEVLGAATALNNAAEILCDQGRLAEARPMFDDALEVCRDHRFSIGIAVVIGNLGRLARRAGELDEAAALLDEARWRFVEIEATDFVVEMALREWGLALARRDLERCHQLADECEAAAGTEDLIGAAIVTRHRLAAITALHLGDRERAVLDYELARSAAQAGRLRYEGALTLEVGVRCRLGRPDGLRLIRELALLGITDTGQADLLPPDPG